MKSILISVLALCLSTGLWAQIKFSEGYFINQQGEKVNCLIKNVGWRFNPSTFEYKTSPESKPLRASIDQVREFAVDNIRFQRFTVQMDRSSDAVSKLDQNRSPNFVEETVFLKPVIEGSATLYLYTEANLKRFFYSTGNDSVKALIYKKFLGANNTVGTNYAFRNQLLTDLSCGSVSIVDVSKLDYSKSDLTNFFKSYNQCKDPSFQFSPPKRASTLNIYIRPGITVPNFTLISPTSSLNNLEFNGITGFRLGIELELVLPTNSNKWSLFTEPTFHSFEGGNVTTNFNNGTIDTYRSIEVPVGIRHYFFLSQKVKLFLNGAFILDLPLEGVLDLERFVDEEFFNSYGAAFGVGVVYNHKLVLETRYSIDRNLLEGEVFWTSDYSVLGIIVGYNIKGK